MNLDIIYWVFSSFSLCFWLFVYIFQIYSRTKDVNNISYYLSTLWLLSDALVLFCSLLIFNTLSNIIVIEALVFVSFDIFSFFQYIILCEKLEKKKIIFTIVIFLLYVILCALGYFYNDVLIPFTWVAIIILVISRIPQIIEYNQKQVNDPKIILFVLVLTLLANISFFISINIDIARKSNFIGFLPWFSCKILIIFLDCFLIFIILRQTRNFRVPL